MSLLTYFLVLFSLTAAVYASLAWHDISISSEEDRYDTRSDCAFGQCGDKLCLLGGRNPGNPEPASVFDTSEDKWETLAAPDVDMHHFQIAADPEDEDSDCVWCGGAFTGPFPHEKLINDVYKFCADDGGKWTKGPKIARPRGAGGAFTYEGKYYLISGNVGGHGNHSKVVPWFDCYDPGSKEWTQLPDIPHPRDHFAAAVMDDKLYVAGGRDGSATDFFNAGEPAVDVYDFSSKKWSTISAEFPTPRGGTLTAVYGDRIVYGGGEGNGKAYKDVHYFDGEEFVKAPSMLTAHHGTNFVSCAGAIWVAGGVSDQADGPKVRSTEVLHEGEDAPKCSKKEANSPGEHIDNSDLDHDNNQDDDEQEKDGDSNKSDDKACFPADALVELADGSFKAMEQLRIGDLVRVGEHDEYSEVYFFSHQAQSVYSKFVQITTDVPDVAILLSPRHLIAANGVLISAGQVKPGDELQITVNKDPERRARVISVTSRTARGLYNPHTFAGTIVVNGVVASTLTESIPPALSKVLLLPFKGLYRLLGKSSCTVLFNKIVMAGLNLLKVHPTPSKTADRYRAAPRIACDRDSALYAEGKNLL